jgi:iron complex transport system substrate-binding protein
VPSLVVVGVRESLASVDIDVVTGEIVDAAFKLHSRLGPGLLEAVFEFEGMRFDRGLSVDLFVDRTVIVELKSVERLLPYTRNRQRPHAQKRSTPACIAIPTDPPRLGPRVQPSRLRAKDPWRPSAQRP